MELFAVLNSLLKLKTNNHLFEDIKINVYCDSKYVVDPINKKYLWTWEKKGFKTSTRTDVANVDIWKQIISLLTHFNNIKFIWVKGHNNNKYNELVNKTAISLSRNNDIIGQVDYNYVK